MRNHARGLALAVTLVVPALADKPAKKGTDADDAFMTGIRKLGVMSGEAFACSSELTSRKLARPLSTSQRK